MIYLGGPYSHPNPEIEAARCEDLTRMATKLVAQGKQVYSPITHTHPIHLELLKGGINMGSEEWCRFDEPFMAACSELMIVMLPGWNESAGVAREIAAFEVAGKPVSYLCPCVRCEAL